MPVPLSFCYITDRKSLAPSSLGQRIAQAVQAGIDLVQIREKDLPTRDLLTVVENAVEVSQETPTRIVVNDRLDVALAAGAAGVHLGRQSVPAEAVRQVVPADFLIGVSCHSLEEAEAAEAARADYIVFGPVFETASKIPYGPPVGLGKLREVTKAISIPVLALGGISVERARPCLDAGAAGIAGISIFQSCDSIETRVKELRGFFRQG